MPSRAAPQGDPEAGEPGLRELAVAALVFLLVAAAVLWRPIVRSSTHTLGAWDLLAMMSDLTDRGEPIAPQNTWASDPVRQMLPWSAYAADEVRAGRMPLWNPYNGAGKPLLANYQSGLLSPFQAPFYVLPFKAAVLLSALAKLWLAGLLMYAFLRVIALSRGASGLGGLVYLASGGHLTFLLFPHPAVSAWLPLALVCAERLVRAAERTGARSALGKAAPLAATMALAALSGHPETLLAVSLVVAAWAAFRLGGMWIARPRSRLDVYGGAVAFVVAALAAVLLAAPQIAPFLEYLARSRALEGGPRTASVLGAENWPFLLFPDLAGSPIAPGGSVADLPRPNYHEVTNVYVGGTALLLALVACARSRLGGRTGLFAGLAALTLALVYDVAGAAKLVALVVPGHHLPLIRLSPLWVVSVAVLAAEGVDGLRSRASPRTALAVVAAAVAIAVAFHLGAEQYLSAASAEGGLDVADWRERISGHRAGMLAWLALGSAGAALWGATRAAWASVGLASIAVAQFAATAGLLSGYTPASPDRHVFPRTPELEALLHATEGERVLFLGAGEISPESNCACRLRTISGFDAVEIADLQRLIARFFGEQRYDGRTPHATVTGLRLLGVRFVAAPHDWPLIGTELSSDAEETAGTSPYLALARRADAPSARTSLPADAELVQRFVAALDGLSGAALHFAPANGAVSALSIELHDLERGLVRGEIVDPARLRRTSSTRRELAFLFAPIEDSAGRSYELRVRALDPALPAPVLRRASAAAPRADDGGESGESGEDGDGPPRRAAEGWELRRGGTGERGRIVLDLAYGSALRRVGTAGEHALFALEGSPGRFWSVARARSASGPDDAWSVVTSPDFDPWREVVLEGVGSEPIGAAAEAALRAEVLGETPGSVRLRVNRPDAGWLVAAQPHFPGWRARVDGLDAPLLRADFALCAVAVPAGEHVVELLYEPESFRLGLLAAVLGALVVAALAFAGRARRAVA